MKKLNWWNIQNEYFNKHGEKDHVWSVFIEEYKRFLETGFTPILEHPENEYWEEKISILNNIFKINTQKFTYDKNDIYVVGDVHGNLSALQSCINLANKTNSIIIFLGDILDHGYENIKCFETVYDLCEKNQAICLKSNHERKHYKYSLIDIGAPIINLTTGNLKTFNELKNLSEEEINNFNSRLRRFWNKSYNYYELDNIVFAHAGIPKNYWNNSMNNKDYNFFIHGDSEDKTRNNSWSEFVPKDKIAVVGHTYYNSYPIIKNNNLNGQTVFLDTGSSKGGQLSVMRLSLNKGKYEFVNFFVF